MLAHSVSVGKLAEGLATDPPSGALLKQLYKQSLAVDLPPCSVFHKLPPAERPECEAGRGSAMWTSHHALTVGGGELLKIDRRGNASKKHMYIRTVEQQETASGAGGAGAGSEPSSSPTGMCLDWVPSKKAGGVGRGTLAAHLAKVLCTLASPCSMWCSETVWCVCCVHRPTHERFCERSIWRIVEVELGAPGTCRNSWPCAHEWLVAQTWWRQGRAQVLDKGTQQRLRASLLAADCPSHVVVSAGLCLRGTSCSTSKALQMQSRRVSLTVMVFRCIAAPPQSLSTCSR